MPNHYQEGRRVEVATLPAAGRSGDGRAVEEARRPRNAGQLKPGQRARAAQRLEKAQAAASMALGAASSYLEAEMDLPAYFAHLGETIAGLVGARRVAFWRRPPHGVLTVQREPFGFGPHSSIRNLNIELRLDGEGIAEGIVFRDELAIARR